MVVSFTIWIFEHIVKYMDMRKSIFEYIVKYMDMRKSIFEHIVKYMDMRKRIFVNISLIIYSVHYCNIYFRK